MKFEMNACMILIIGGLKVNRAGQINCKSGSERPPLGTLNRVMGVRRVHPDKMVNKFVFASNDEMRKIEFVRQYGAKFVKSNVVK